MSPFDGAIAAARTCYSPRVIGVTEVTERQRDSIGRLTFDGGHHTVYQHAHFEFGLENISRQFVWTFLHSYPFYNSEQSSQRYVKLKEPRAMGDGSRMGVEEVVFDYRIGNSSVRFPQSRGPRVTLRFSITNLTNKLALYNFLSTFSGTHFVPPRTYQASIGYAF